MKRVNSGRKTRMFIGRLLVGMTAASVFVSSLAVPGNWDMQDWMGRNCSPSLADDMKIGITRPIRQTI